MYMYIALAIMQNSKYCQKSVRCMQCCNVIGTLNYLIRFHHYLLFQSYFNVCILSIKQGFLCYAYFIIYILFFICSMKLLNKSQLELSSLSSSLYNLTPTFRLILNYILHLISQHLINSFKRFFISISNLYMD